MKSTPVIGLLLGVPTLAGPAQAQFGYRNLDGDRPPLAEVASRTQDDSLAAARVLDRFHAALAAGDSVAALALLAPDVVILESGGSENLAEFRSHHLAADIEFARAVKSDRGPRRVTIRGDVAWVTSTSTAVGEFRGRQINSSGAELAVLVRMDAGWRIAAFHWSSRTRR